MTGCKKAGVQKLAEFTRHFLRPLTGVGGSALVEGSEMVSTMKTRVGNIV